MKTNKILLGASLLASLFAVAACGEVTPSTQPSSEAPVAVAIAEFVGSTTIDGTTYNVVLGLYENNKAVLTIGNGVDPIEGTYTFVEGKGYEFELDDEKLKTVWDATTSSHTLEYTLRLGDLGSGTVTLTLLDANFVYTGKAPKVEYAEKAVFRGELNVMGVWHIELTFEDGQYTIDVLDVDQGGYSRVAQLINRTGAYTFENNTYTLTIDGTEFKTVYNLHTGAYALDYSITGDYGPTAIHLEYQPEVVFVGELSNWGGLVFELHAYSDGTCLADVTTTLGGNYDIWFDKTGTWTKDANGEFVFSIASLTAEPTEFVAAVNPASGALEVNYKLQGQDGLLEPVLTCKPVVLSAFAEQLGGIYFDLVFTSATEAFVDVTCVAEAFPGMNAMFDKAGTYTFENNVISLTVGEETFTSTFAEETGTYTLNYVLVGQQATLYPALVTSLWAE